MSDGEREFEPGELLPPMADEHYASDARPLRPTVLDLPPTLNEALCNAARLLRAAEADTDRGLMERFEKLADSWIGLASLLIQKEHAG
jgi:hypothetical protein